MELKDCDVCRKEYFQQVKLFINGDNGIDEAKKFRINLHGETAASIFNRGSSFHVCKNCKDKINTMEGITKGLYHRRIYFSGDNHINKFINKFTFLEVFSLNEDLEISALMSKEDIFTLLGENGLFVITPVANWIIYKNGENDRITFVLHAHFKNKGWHVHGVYIIHSQDELKGFIYENIVSHDWKHTMKTEGRAYPEDAVFIHKLDELMDFDTLK